MITSIYNLENELITDIVDSAILNPETIQIKNKLLDGTYHIQTIGIPIIKIDILCYVDRFNKPILDSMYSIGEPIKLILNGKYYIGVIHEKSEWEIFARVKNGLYEAQLEMVVDTEGII